MVRNKLEEYVENLNKENVEKAKEISDFLMEFLKGKKLEEFIPTYRVQGCSRPRSLICASSEEILNQIITGKIDSEKFSGQRGTKLIYENVHFYKIPVGIGIKSPGLNVEKISRYHNDGFGSYGYEKISEYDIKLERFEKIQEFSTKLVNLSFIEMGFEYDKSKRELVPNIGKEIKEMNKTNLENCLKEHLIEPSWELKFK